MPLRYRRYQNNRKRNCVERRTTYDAKGRTYRRSQEIHSVQRCIYVRGLTGYPACQHVLRILTGIVDLIVKEVITQYSVTKVTSHSARLDVMAEDEKGKLYNIEIQRRDCVDHARRTRFYGAMIDSEFLEKGKAYEEMPDVYIIYISETDIWKAGKTKYVVEKYFSGTDMAYEDGIHILYVNAAVYDGTETAKMMEYFKYAGPDDASQGDLSRRVMLLKCEKELTI